MGPNERFRSARLDLRAEEVLAKTVAQREIRHVTRASLSGRVSS